jgi:two-component system, chemotaxis family, sensor kinase Cph1
VGFAISAGLSASMDAEFLDALRHDLNGPIARVRMLSELLGRRAAGLDEEARQWLEHIGASASAAEGVLEAVRRYGDVARLPFQPSCFDLEFAVQAARDRMKEQLRSSGAEVTSEGLPQIYGDLVQMAALFEELIGNALHFRCEPPPRVEIRTVAEETNADWLVSIRDNGIGLEGLDLQRIFRPFGKAGGRSGPSIGLAICRRIAHLHRGEITAVGQPQGAEFRLRLPK